MSNSEHTVFCCSNVLTLREAMVKHPREAFRSQAFLDQTCQGLGFDGLPEMTEAMREYDAFAELLGSQGVALTYLPTDDSTDPDSLYTHDPVVSAAGGIVLCRMGKVTRRNEAAAVGRWASKSGVKILGSIKAPGLLEGGDLIWMDENTVAIGIGFRSNSEGARQFGRLTGTDVIEVSLPYWNGPSDVLHLMSLISPLDTDLALVYRRLLPVTFVQALEARGIQLVGLAEDEYDSLGCNVLALGPRRCLVVEGNPKTRRRLEAAGCEVVSFKGAEIARKGQGGPTCLTRPLVRR
jgi:arginine deiminase